MTARQQERAAARPARPVEVVEAIAYHAIDLYARRTLARAVELRVEGVERLPRVGATLIVAHHFHHLYDGLILLREARRPAHIFVALDWTRTPLQRRGMELACRLARWPAILRTDAFALRQGFYDGVSAYRLREAPAMLRAATRMSLELLRAGETLVIFPEAYPVIDPFPTPKSERADGETFLPFAPGFARLAQLAERDGRTQVSIIPTGLVYERLATARPQWRVTLRFGEPTSIAARATPAEVAALVAQVEQTTRALSAPISPTRSARSQTI
ncbi:MAG TPA: 1-acyl-sn-glycerol-3-phosphate acyltransferase [Ktedonobacterales bacterium]